ncbi:MAG: hypothetical protein R3E04_03100 [Sphingobium sp.]
MEAIAPETDDGRRAVIEAALKAYCARDTEAMIVLAAICVVEMAEDRLCLSE